MGRLPKAAPPQQDGDGRVWPVSRGIARTPLTDNDSPWDAVTLVQQVRGLLGDYFDGWGYSAERDENYQIFRAQLLATLNGPPFVDVIAAAIRASAPPAPLPNLTETVGTLDYADALLPVALGFLDPNVDAHWWDHVGSRRLDSLCSWLILTLRQTRVPRPRRPAAGPATPETADEVSAPNAASALKPPTGESTAAPNAGPVRTAAAKRLAQRRQAARKLAAQGAPNTKIAEKLGVSERTVYNYLKDPKP